MLPMSGVMGKVISGHLRCGCKAMKEGDGDGGGGGGGGVSVEASYEVRAVEVTPGH